MEKDIFISQALKLFPELNDQYIEHMGFNQEFLGHVFFGDEVSTHEERLLQEHNDIEKIRNLLLFLNGWHYNRTFRSYKYYRLRYCTTLEEILMFYIKWVNTWGPILKGSQ